MVAKNAAGQSQDPSKNRVEPAAANPANSTEYGTLIFDDSGRISGCDAAAERLFGTSQSRLIGRWIPEFIVGILFDGNSPSENARQLDRLCAERHWQGFEAMDAHGNIFAIEIQASRKMASGQEVFVLSLRQPGDPSCR
jgi:PAS domain S-box-containing protein